MTERARILLPSPRLEGESGTGNPNDRETRYSAYSERLTTHVEAIDEKADNA